jgi:hydrophobe/amphiphile efflux-3 (HAE3) family protein
VVTESRTTGESSQAAAPSTVTEEPARRRTEHGWWNRFFEGLTRFVLRYRWAVVVLVVAVTAVLTMAMDDLHIDSSNELWLVEGDPQLAIMRTFEDRFYNDDFIYVLGEFDDFFKPETLRLFGRLADDLKQHVPYVEDVTWIGNAEFMDGYEDRIEIHPLFQTVPETAADLAAARRKALSEPVYRNSLISPDGKVAALVVEMGAYPTDRVDPRREVGPAVNAVLAKPEYRPLHLRAVGGPLLHYEIDKLTGDQAKLLLPLCVLLQAAILFWVGRGVRGILVPLAIVSLAVAWTFGTIGLYGYPLNLFAIIVPILLICVGIGDSVHVIAEYHGRRDLGVESERALVEAVGAVGLPCLLTSLTTAAGFLAFRAAPVRPFREMGVYCATGVAMALVLTYVLVPVIYSWHPPRAGRSHAPSRRWLMFDRMLAGGYRLVVGHPRALVAAFALLAVAGLAGAWQVKVESTTVRLFSPDVPLRQNYEYVDQKMGNSMSIEIMLDTGRSGGVAEPAFLRKMAALDSFVKTQPLVTATSSVLDLLRQMRRAFHENDQAYYSIPESRDEASQYLLLYEMSGGENKEKLVTYDYDVARLTVRTRSLDSKDVRTLLSSISGFATSTFGSDVSVEFAGMMPWEKIMNDRVAAGQRASFLAAIVVIGVIMMIFLRSVKLGIISMIPNVFPAIMTLGIMGFAGIYMDLGVMCIGAIVIGVAVDDTIHFYVRYRHEFERCRSYTDALWTTISTVGRPIVFTTVILTVGFSVLMLSDVTGMVKFGFLAGFAFTWAILADLLLSPALLILMHPLGQERIAAPVEPVVPDATSGGDLDEPSCGEPDACLP